MGSGNTSDRSAIDTYLAPDSQLINKELQHTFRIDLLLVRVEIRLENAPL